jgi:hypothetical protein
MAQSKGARPKGAVAGGGGRTVNVVLSRSTAQDLLHALSQGLGGGVGSKAKARPKAAARPKATARPKAAAKPKAV